MFNKTEQREQIKSLNKQLNEAQKRIIVLESILLVRDSFSRCNGSNYIQKSEAMSFQKIGYDLFHNVMMVITDYTSKENYANHLPLIKKLEKEVEEYNKSRV